MSHVHFVTWHIFDFMQDWKDMLGAAFGIDPTQQEQQEPPQSAPRTAAEQQGGVPVHVIIDKKGRHGKQATIVTDLKCDDDTLKMLARDLKQVCGAGGSARDGEILIQGDKREAVAAHLKTLGFKVK